MIRKTIPPAVLELAERVGADGHQTGRRVVLAQSGSLRNGPNDRWRRFAARQWIALDRPGFNWTAKTGPLGLLTVSDQLNDSQPEGWVRLFGIITVIRAKPSDALMKGELMRYLAELPWAPDALLTNDQLDWAELESARLRVSITIAGVEASVIFTLNSNGLISGVEASDRPRQEGSAMRERPWFGTFTDYHDELGRRIPHAAEVGWDVSGTRFPVWKGRLDNWSILPKA
jgi:hypothetical protein